MEHGVPVILEAGSQGAGTKSGLPHTSENDDRRILKIVPVICLLAAVLEGLDVQSTGVAGSQILAAYDLDPTAAAVIFSASPFGLLFDAILGGVLGKTRRKDQPSRCHFSA